jgi:hypothetical protein
VVRIDPRIVWPDRLALRPISGDQSKQERKRRYAGSSPERRRTFPRLCGRLMPRLRSSSRSDAPRLSRAPQTPCTGLPVRRSSACPPSAVPDTWIVQVGHRTTLASYTCVVTESFAACFAEVLQ